jgi:TrmH family RNA methyltransferase
LTPEDANNLRIVLVSPRNPLNIGAAARAMSNFGFRNLRLVNPYEVAYREARSAVNASAILESAKEYKTLPEAVADCTLVVGTTAAQKRELHHPLRRLEYAGKLLRKALPMGPVALLFGSEKFGLGNDDLAYCHWLLRIPTREEHGSMNLGQSVALCLYELIRVAKAPKPEPSKRPKSEDLERLTELLREVLDRSGYVHATSTEAKVRRLVRRLDLNAHDAEIWVGMLRQILWKLGRTPSSTGARRRSGEEPLIKRAAPPSNPRTRR